MVNKWVPTSTGAAFSADPRILLRNYLNTSANWANSGLTFALMTIDTKLTKNAKQLTIIVEKIPHAEKKEYYMGNLKYIEDHYRIYCSAKGWSQLNNAYLMSRRVIDLIDANRLALLSDGIEEMWIDDFDLIEEGSQEPLNAGVATTKNSSTSTTTYLVRATLRYGLAQISI